ncbi:hypothetical protein [Planctomicrobium piriforme]|uniref:Uncharacterized protein n=1 Tax=Planctomicrobium piriforme TaxID=1576369 RepID=A0A1I3SI87_9PLAN|nr:hypothetical protein [Planctomicrobium piriforme]SFJ58414.1 hypothetical protein SAMN05421753_12443 [Planctomicrobium piriforme]
MRPQAPSLQINKAPKKESPSGTDGLDLTKIDRKERAPKERVPGMVRPDEVYTLKEFMARTGMGESALRAARRKCAARHEEPLVFYAHKLAFIHGKRWLEYLYSENMEKSRPKDVES